MQQRELRRQRQDPAADGPPPPGGTDPEAQRQTVARLLRASRNAIDNALSTNSAQFNESVRQPGGQ